MDRSSNAKKGPSGVWLAWKFLTSRAKSALGPAGRATAAKHAGNAVAALAVAGLIGLGFLSLAELPALAAVAAKSFGGWSGLLAESGESYYGFGLEGPEMEEWRSALARSESKEIKARAESSMEDARAKARAEGSKTAWVPARAVEKLSGSALAGSGKAPALRREAALAALSASLAEGESDAVAMGKARAAASAVAKSHYAGGLMAAAGSPKVCEGLELARDFMPWMEAAPQCVGNKGRGIMLVYWLSGFALLLVGVLGLALSRDAWARVSGAGKAWAQARKEELEAQWEKEQIEAQAASGSKPEKANSRRL